MLVKTFWSFSPRRKYFFKIGIFFVCLIRIIPKFFLGMTVELQDKIVPKKVREGNVLKFANNQSVNIQIKIF